MWNQKAETRLAWKISWTAKKDSVLFFRLDGPKSGIETAELAKSPDVLFIVVDQPLSFTCVA